jgi:hypothetical protein
MVLSVQYWLLALCQWQKQNSFNLSTFRNVVGGEGSDSGGASAVVVLAVRGGILAPTVVASPHD